jgi:signal transduction histidine kinase
LNEQSKKNKRTLKKRIRRILFMCILITIIMFSSLVVWAGAIFFRVETAFLSDYFSTYIAQSMNSEIFLKQMDIKSLKDLRLGSEKFKAWVTDVKQNGHNTVKLIKPAMNINDIQAYIHEKNSQDSNTQLPDQDMQKIYSYINNGDLLSLNILVYGELVYTDENDENNKTIGYLNKVAENNFSNSSLGNILHYFNMKSVSNISDENGVNIASVVVNVNDGFILALGILFVAGVIFSGIFSFIIGLIIARLLTIPVTTPLIKLDEKIKAIASGSYESAMEAHIVLKRPLQEIESLADSTNSIMVKMKEHTDLLFAQNEELEAQNEELANSKKQIEEAQNLLVQTENMASIGQLTAAITHEINTPLGAIHSNAQICEMLLDGFLKSETVKGNKDVLELAVQMQDANNISIMASNRVSQIIRSLKTFSKVDQAEFQEADINESIRSVLVLTSNLWKRKITVHEDYGPIPQIKCFPGMLNQVFMNLVVNAVQSIEENGYIYIKTWNDERYEYISIRDTGSGISEDNISRIFDTGFTTKGSNLGMGLGLSISRNIINKHNGEIKVNSTPGIGTEFIVSIPLQAGDIANTP